MMRGNFKLRPLPKNGPDALKMGCLFYPRKQTSISYATDCDLVVYGGAKLADSHLASKVIHCVDDEIFEFFAAA
jgi:hypothetical protein